jgi:LmbE family N-acetylglucosaminyl deacetylase
MTASRILAVVAHPDDEALGAGGTLARHVAEGALVTSVFLTDGVGARGSNDAAVNARARAAHEAAKLLGCSKPHFFSYPDNRLDEVALLDVVQPLERLIQECRPDVIYTHHGGDLNVDHAICYRAVMTACRPLPGSNVRHIYGMEVASSTEWALDGSSFQPTRFVDISATIKAKRLALDAYADEMRPAPHPRSFEAIEALAHWRGATAGVDCAEAFTVLRSIER